MKKSFNLIILGIFICIHSTALNSGKQAIISITKISSREYVSLNKLSKSFKLDNALDLITQKGKLYHKTNIAVYQVGLSVILVNGSLLKYPYPVIRHKGEILLPAGITEDLAHYFYQRSKVIRHRNHYAVLFIEQTGEKTRISPPVIKSSQGKDRISFIIIDPGHGGKDPGAIGKGGVKEKTITLRVAKKLESYLKRKGIHTKVIMTRRSDIFIELIKRTEISNRYLKEGNNGVFVSIHVNASISHKISGFETYFLSQNPSNEESRATAALENNVIVLEDKTKQNSYNDIEHMEAFMLTNQIQKESTLLAKSIQYEMKKKIKPFKPRGVRKADFFVLRGALMPAVLVEIGFITNNRELSYLKKSSYQKTVAEGIGNGIISFIKKYNKMIKNK